MSTQNKSHAELIQELAVVRAQLAAKKRQCRELSRELEGLQSRAALKSDSRSRLFGAMMEGFGLAEVIRDENGRPHDFRLLEINETAGRILGIAPEKVGGVTLRQLIPNVDPDWINLLGQAALGREPAQFEKFSPALAKWFAV